MRKESMRSDTERAGTLRRDTPGPDTPGPDTPGPDTPGPDTPGPDTPRPDTPGQILPGQIPLGQIPLGQIPPGQIPPGQIPQGQSPYGPAPDAQEPNVQTPYGQAPYMQTPYGEWPHAEQYQQYAYVPVAENDKEKSGRSTWITVTMVTTVVLILMGIVLGMLVFTGNTRQSPDTTAALEVTETSAPPTVVIIEKPASPVDSTTARPVITRPSSATPPASRSPHTATEPPTEHKPEKVDREPLVCIMGDRLTSVQQFPPDRMCDYIFYDSLYKEGDHNLLPDQTTYSESLNTFINDSLGYRHTTLGLGFSFDFLAMAEEDLKAGNPSPLKHFWNRGIFHAGILDTATNSTRQQTKAAIATLKTINGLLDTLRNRGEIAITAIAVPHPDLDWAFSFAEDFRELRFTPDMFISIGHYRLGDEPLGFCYIVPPTRHPKDVPSQHVLRDYSFDVSSPMYQLRYLYANGTVTTGLLGLTLKGRFSLPAFGFDVDFYQLCLPQATEFGSYTEVCPGGGGRLVAQLNYSAAHYAVFTQISSISRTFTYDNEESFIQKLTAVKKPRPQPWPFGIAVYGVDYDDYDNSCGTLNRNGAYSRLKELRKLLDLFKSNYKNRFPATPPSELL
ncbi:hypothetical protein MTO96_017633 [Rhipicephalus appendiculatus]